ncbi:MAG TPA: hypothetical protein VF591_06270 [Pyrinomonadaceae bacterium]|jgi:hypothetical protein
MFEAVKKLLSKNEEPKDRLRPIRRRLILRGLRFTFWHYLPSPYLDLRTRFIWGVLNSFVFWLIVSLLIGFGPVKILSAGAMLAILQAIPFLLNIFAQSVIFDKRLADFISRHLFNPVDWVLLTNVFAVLSSYFFDFVVTLAGLSFYIGRQDVFAVGSSVVGVVENSLINHPHVGVSFVLAGTALIILDIFASIDRPTAPLKKFRRAAGYSLFTILPIIFLISFGISFFKDKPSLAALTLLLMGLQGLVGSPLLFVVWLMLSGLAATFTMMLNLIQVRANVLALTTLAATIPFLNSDSWQLVSRLEWPRLAGVAFLVYVLPILLLVVSKWDVIKEEMYTKGWVQGEEFTEEGLVGRSEAAGLELDDATREAVRAGLSEAEPLAPLDFPVVMLKGVAKWVVFVVLTPATVFLFILMLFNMIMGDELLTNWLANPSTPAPLTVMGVVIGPYTDVRVKAAIFLALLSAGSTIVTLFNSREELAAFIREEFVKDIKLDKHLLALYRSAEHGFEIISKKRADDKGVAAAATD